MFVKLSELGETLVFRASYMYVCVVSGEQQWRDQDRIGMQPEVVLVHTHVCRLRLTQCSSCRAW